MDFVIEKGIFKKYGGTNKNIVIPDGVTSIGESAFAYSDIESVSIPNSVEEINEKAFFRCFSLKEVIMPDSVKVIGKQAFQECRALSTFSVPKNLKEIQYGAFAWCGLSSIEIPESVTKIEDCALHSIKNITIYGKVNENLFDICKPSILFDKEFSSEITVLSEDGSVHSRVLIISDGKPKTFNIFIDCCKNGESSFDFSEFDQSFKLIKNSKIKKEIAEFRLNNPYDLSEENEKMYASLLKRTTQKTDNKNTSFEIKGKTLLKYLGKDSQSKVVIPEGITTIGKYAFKKINDTVEEIIMPEGVTTIESDSYDNGQAFAGCCKLKRIILPDTLLNIPFDTFENSHSVLTPNGYKTIGQEIDYNQYDNGLYLGNDKNPYICFVKPANKDITEITLHEDCRVVCGDAFVNCAYLTSITLPNTLQKIEEGDIYNRHLKPDIFQKPELTVNMPENYFRTTKKLPTTLTYTLLSTKWSNQVTFEDLVWIYLFQSGKKIEDLCLKTIKTEPEKTVADMLTICSNHQIKSAISKMVQYTFEFKGKLDKQSIMKVVQIAEIAKLKTKELSAFSNMVKEDISAEKDELLEYCLNKFDHKKTDEILKKATINTKNAYKKKPVKYKESDNEVPEYVVRCVLALYIEPIIMHLDSKINREADQIVENFDNKSFNDFLKIVGERVLNKFKQPDSHFAIYGVEKFDLMIPMLCRFMDEEMVKTCINQYYINNNCKYDYADDKQRLVAYNDLLLESIIMSDTKAAVDFCVENGVIDRYAVARGKSTKDFTNDKEGSSENELIITKAIQLYDRCLKQLDKIMENEYNYPTVIDCVSMGSISKDNSLANEFFDEVCKRYAKKVPDSVLFNDREYSPDELSNLWKEVRTIEEGQVGICFTVGIVVAYYMFELKDVLGELTFCRDKWEYRGDYSSPTRAALHVDPDVEKWEVYTRRGYEKYDM